MAEDSATAAKIAANNRELACLSRSTVSLKSLLSSSAEKLGQIRDTLVAEKAHLTCKKQALRRSAEQRMKAQAESLKHFCLSRSVQHFDCPASALEFTAVICNLAVMAQLVCLSAHLQLLDLETWQSSFHACCFKLVTLCSAAEEEQLQTTGRLRQSITRIAAACCKCESREVLSVPPTTGHKTDSILQSAVMMPAASMETSQDSRALPSAQHNLQGLGGMISRSMLLTLLRELELQKDKVSSLACLC